MPCQDDGRLPVVPDHATRVDSSRSSSTQSSAASAYASDPKTKLVIRNYYEPVSAHQFLATAKSLPSLESISWLYLSLEETGYLSTCAWLIFYFYRVAQNLTARTFLDHSSTPRQKVGAVPGTRLPQFKTESTLAPEFALFFCNDLSPFPEKRRDCRLHRTSELVHLSSFPPRVRGSVEEKRKQRGTVSGVWDIGGPVIEALILKDVFGGLWDAGSDEKQSLDSRDG
ncbi:hypothetical protein JHW43_003983 [Diplocarpon mali]|nr:hypothetical protein JHW43_003983 [Diplocarpon mali]